MNHALIQTFAVIFAAGSLWGVVWFVLGMMNAKPMNRYVDRPVHDERNWQAAFRKSVKP